MAAREEVRAVIIGEDRASAAFSRAGESVKAMGLKMDATTKSSAFLDDALKRQAVTAGRSADATLALAKSDEILREVQRRLADGALEAEFALKKEADAKLKDAAASRIAAAENRKLADSRKGLLSRIAGGAGSGVLALPGLAGQGASGALGAVPLASNPWAGAGLLAGAVAAAPFLGQLLGGGIVTALGGGLAGLGIAGAMTTGKAPPKVTANQLAAAQLRLTAAQDSLARLQGGTQPAPGSLASGQAAVLSAEAALRKAAPSQRAIDQLRLTAAQARLTALQGGGAAAPGSVASAQAGVLSAQDSLSKLQAQSAAATAFAAENKMQLQAKAAFASLADNAKDSLATIGTSFVPVMKRIFDTANDVLKSLTPVFAAAVKAISGPFALFSDVLIRTFDQSAVKSSIADVAKSFGAILTAVTPALAGIVSNVAIGIDKIAKAVSANPRGFADLIEFFGQAVGGALTAIAWLTRVANYIEAHFAPAMHRVAVIFDGVRHDIAHVWDQIWNNSIGSVIRIGHNVETQFNSLRHGTAVVFDGMRGDIAHYWDMTWNNTVGRVSRGIGDVARWFASLPKTVAEKLSGFGSALAGIGRSAVAGLYGGITGALADAGRWVRDHIFDPIVGAIKSLFGIHSPSTVMAGIGGHLVSGLFLGLLRANPAAMIGKVFGGLPSALGSLVEKGLVSIASLPAKALKALGGSFGSFKYAGSPDVTGWLTGALTMDHLPLSWMPALQALVGKESGGNPNAVNPVSVGGEHAEGLLQTLPSTYAAFGGPPGGIFNPVLNAAAALRYIAATYGSPFNIPGLTGGAYAGYAAGTMSAAPGWAWVGERGPELMRFRGGEQVIPAGRSSGGGAGPGGPVTIVIENHGVIGSQAETDRWLNNGIDRLAKNGKLTYALRRSPSAG